MAELDPDWVYHEPLKRAEDAFDRGDHVKAVEMARVAVSRVLDKARNKLVGGEIKVPRARDRDNSVEMGKLVEAIQKSLEPMRETLLFQALDIDRAAFALQDEQLRLWARPDHHASAEITPDEAKRVARESIEFSRKFVDTVHAKLVSLGLIERFRDHRDGDETHEADSTGGTLD